MSFTDAAIEANVDRFVADNYEFRLVKELDGPYEELNISQSFHSSDNLHVLVTNEIEGSVVLQTTVFEMNRAAATALKNWLIEQGY